MYFTESVKTSCLQLVFEETTIHRSETMSNLSMFGCGEVGIGYKSIYSTEHRQTTFLDLHRRHAPFHSQPIKTVISTNFQKTT